MTYRFKLRKPPGERWRALNETYTPKAQLGDRVLLRNDEEDMVADYNEALKMFTLRNHEGMFSVNDLIVITEEEK